MKKKPIDQKAREWMRRTFGDNYRSDGYGHGNMQYAYECGYNRAMRDIREARRRDAPPALDEHDD